MGRGSGSRESRHLAVRIDFGLEQRRVGGAVAAAHTGAHVRAWPSAVPSVRWEDVRALMIGRQEWRETRTKLYTRTHSPACARATESHTTHEFRFRGVGRHAAGLCSPLSGPMPSSQIPSACTSVGATTSLMNHAAIVCDRRAHVRQDWRVNHDPSPMTKGSLWTSLSHRRWVMINPSTVVIVYYSA